MEVRGNLSLKTRTCTDTEWKNVRETKSKISNQRNTMAPNLSRAILSTWPFIPLIIFFRSYANMAIVQMFSEQFTQTIKLKYSEICKL